MIDWRQFLPKGEYPRLAAEEQIVAEAPLPGGVALLTNRRLVVANGSGEKSVALSAVGAVEVGFERPARDLAIGGALVVVALLLFMLAAPIAGFLAAQSGALESIFRQEGLDPNAATGVARQAQYWLGLLARLARWMPLVGWVVLVWGALKLIFALRGRTEVNVLSVVGPYQLAQNGRSDPLDALGRELARRVSEARK